ncbi:MAG: pyridoxamine 5'-phosphate oxidase family protein [Prolixibacteraceae bacterium]|nr:pyridoxamine 5'-phosphate oxidase family protein [Prolixibacteraceae bacterium]
MRTLLIKNNEEIEQIIKLCRICYLAMSENNFPYVLPMNFAVDGDSVILHSAQSGRMWKTLKKNPNVCINWTQGDELAWQDVKVGCSYRVKSKSVVAEGRVEFIENFDEKVRCMKKILSQYSNREFRFSDPAVRNVGVLKVRIRKISGKEFGAKAVTPWNS